jgi:ankyrin repeat protein
MVKIRKYTLKNKHKKRLTGGSDNNRNLNRRERRKLNRTLPKLQAAIRRRISNNSPSPSADSTVLPEPPMIIPQTSPITVPPTLRTRRRRGRRTWRSQTGSPILWYNISPEEYLRQTQNIPVLQPIPMPAAEPVTLDSEDNEIITVNDESNNEYKLSVDRKGNVTVLKDGSLTGGTKPSIPFGFGSPDESRAKLQQLRQEAAQAQEEKEEYYLTPDGLAHAEAEGLANAIKQRKRTTYLNRRRLEREDVRALEAAAQRQSSRAAPAAIGPGPNPPTIHTPPENPPPDVDACLALAQKTNRNDWYTFSPTCQNLNRKQRRELGRKLSKLQSTFKQNIERKKLDKERKKLDKLIEESKKEYQSDFENKKIFPGSFGKPNIFYNDSAGNIPSGIRKSKRHNTPEDEIQLLRLSKAFGEPERKIEKKGPFTYIYKGAPQTRDSSIFEKALKSRKSKPQNVDELDKFYIEDMELYKKIREQEREIEDKEGLLDWEEDSQDQTGGTPNQDLINISMGQISTGNIDEEIEKLQEALDNGANINTRDNTGRTALSYAAADSFYHNTGRNEIIEFLLENGANVNLQDNNGNSALIWAITYSNLEFARILLENGANPNMPDYQLDETPLHLAVQIPYIDMVELLLENGANPHQLNIAGDTPLHLACTHTNNPRMFEILLRYGANENIPNSAGETASYLIQNHPNPQLRNILMETRRQIDSERISIDSLSRQRNISDNVMGFRVKKYLRKIGGKKKMKLIGGTPDDDLLQAVIDNDYAGEGFYVNDALLDKLRIAIESGANVNIQTSRGYSPLIFLAKSDVKEPNIEMVDLLLRNGANPNLQDRGGETALHWASARGFLEMVEKLLESENININITNIDGRNALHSIFDDEEEIFNPDNVEPIMKLLIEKGININETDDSGKTALHLAAEQNKGRAVGILLRAGADENIKTYTYNPAGQTAYELAENIRNDIELRRNNMDQTNYGDDDNNPWAYEPLALNAFHEFHDERAQAAINNVYLAQEAKNEDSYLNSLPDDLVPGIRNMFGGHRSNRKKFFKDLKGRNSHVKRIISEKYGEDVELAEEHTHLDSRGHFVYKLKFKGNVTNNEWVYIGGLTIANTPMNEDWIPIANKKIINDISNKLDVLGIPQVQNFQPKKNSPKKKSKDADYTQNMLAIGNQINSDKPEQKEPDKSDYVKWVNEWARENAQKNERDRLAAAAAKEESRQKMISIYSPPKSKEKSKGEKKSRRAAIREKSELERLEMEELDARWDMRMQKLEEERAIRKRQSELALNKQLTLERQRSQRKEHNALIERQHREQRGSREEKIEEEEMEKKMEEDNEEFNKETDEYLERKMKEEEVWNQTYNKEFEVGLDSGLNWDEAEAYANEEADKAVERQHQEHKAPRGELGHREQQDARTLSDAQRARAEAKIEELTIALAQTNLSREERKKLRKKLKKKRGALVYGFRMRQEQSGQGPQHLGIVAHETRGGEYNKTLKEIVQDFKVSNNL